MKTTKALEALTKALQPYLFYWQEWTLNENCNLTTKEIDLVNFYLQTNFESNFFDLVTAYKQTECIYAIIKKLDIGLQVFKDVVIVNFLSTLITLAKTYPEGYQKFLKSPIKSLDIPEELKLNLLGFKAHSLHVLFIIFKTEEFSHGWVYNQIVEFQKIKRSHEIFINPKTTAMKTNSS